MYQRTDYFQIAPELIGDLREITKRLNDFSIDRKLRALVETRVSQINGCVYCVDLHTREARSHGESQQRLDTLAVWRESPFFDDKEKAALAWAEVLTLIPQTHAADDEYSRVSAAFSEREVVELSIVISLTNFWNRMAGGFRRMPARVNAS